MGFISWVERNGQVGSKWFINDVEQSDVEWFWVVRQLGRTAGVKWFRGSSSTGESRQVPSGLGVARRLGRTGRCQVV